MEAVERKVAESEAESETEEGATEVEIEVDLGELLKEASKNDIRLKLTSNSTESKATATMNSQDEGSESRKKVAVGVISLLVVLLFVPFTLQYYPQQGFAIMLGAIGGIFGNIVYIMSYISKALEELTNRNE